MKVIDKRTEKNDDWHVGDVVCYYNNFGRSDVRHGTNFRKYLFFKSRKMAMNYGQS